MTESRRLLQHFLAALAYRTQKALRDAPAGFADFRAGTHVRTPHELLWHMTGVVGYARTMLRGGEFAPPRLDTLAEEIARFHATLGALRDDLGDATLAARISDEQFLHGPLADAMTHAGQLAMLRRMAGAPVPSENFIFADVSAGNVGAEQPPPVAPDAWWRPDQPPLPPGPDPTGMRVRPPSIEKPVRQYRYPATDATIEALRRLRGAWTGYVVADDAMLVALLDGGTVRIHVEGADVEAGFEAFRLSAALTDAAVEQPVGPEAFGSGGNDVVIFTSETWIEAPDASDAAAIAADRVVQFTGSPLQRSESATATCAVDDAAVVATRAGTGMLIRCGLRPYTLEVSTEPAVIARFLAERQYGAASPEA